MSATAPLAAARGRPVRDFMALTGLGWGQAAIVFGLTFGFVAFEGFGIALIVPLLEVILAGGEAANITQPSAFWQALATIFDRVGIAPSLPWLLGATLTAILARQAFKYFQAVYLARTEQDLVLRIRVRGLAAGLEARLDHHDRIEIGDLVSDLVTQTQAAVRVIFLAIQAFGNGLLVAVYFTLLIGISWQLTLVVLATGPFAMFFLRRLMTRSRVAGESIAGTNRELSTFLIERLKHLRLIRLSGTESVERARMADLAGRLGDQTVLVKVLRARIPLFVEPATAILILGFVWFSLSAFTLLPGEILAFMFVVMRAVPIGQELATTIQKMQSQHFSMRYVDDRLRSLDAAREADGGGDTFRCLDREIRFRDVHFTYPDGRVALDGVDVRVPARRITALVGPSGAGKSTLVDLLPRLREPSSGRVLLDDTPIEAFTRASLRAGIAFVPQEPQLFNVSAVEHIRYGRPAATEAEVIEAARLAGAHDFIAALPQGYDTPLGEDGGRLSGGQRQRLDLARALVRRSPVLILDEPATGLDAEAAAHVHAALGRIRRETETTIILIAHGFSLVTDADRIVVLEAGRVTGTGSHTELMRQGGWYARAFARQRGEAPAGPLIAVADQA